MTSLPPEAEQPMEPFEFYLLFRFDVSSFSMTRDFQTVNFADFGQTKIDSHFPYFGQVKIDPNCLFFKLWTVNVILSAFYIQGYINVGRI